MSGRERQAEIVLDQITLCLTTAGSSLEKVVKCNVFCTDAAHFASVNAVYTSRVFGDRPSARALTAVSLASNDEKDQHETDCG